MPIDDLVTGDRPDALLGMRERLAGIRREGVAFFPSPIDWRDEILYFLLPDRFSDGREDERPALTREDIVSLRRAPQRPDIDWRNWAESGKRWQGGTLAGIAGRLDYLQRLGVTALWIGPVLKQRARVDTYHGYGIQDFLEVEPRFGTRAALRGLIDAAHHRGIRVVLDIIVNHSGDNWGYVPPGRPLGEAANEPAFRAWPDFYGNPGGASTAGWTVAWRGEDNAGFTTVGEAVQRLHDGVWPAELRRAERYTRAGKGDLAAGAIDDADAEHKRTDFFALKDLALDVPPTLSLLVDCYKYWIAVSDCDGFRIDTVKHMSLEEARNFCGAIREFADTLGKRNFLLLGEIAGGDEFQDFVLDNLAVLQRNLSAALDIGSARTTLHAVAKGLRPGIAYLGLFREAGAGFESHRSFGNRHVSILDDHDHVIGSKVRFSSEIPDDSPVKDHHIAAATAIQFFTLGIPCLYYGSEQAFAGPAHSQLPFVLAEGWNDGRRGGDRFLREAMFGPPHPRAAFTNDLDTQLHDTDPELPGFGPFGTVGKHAFDAASPAYVRIAALAAVRARFVVLRIGRQYPREIRLPHIGFHFPAAGEVVAWSRLLDTVEALCVVNANGTEARGGDIVVSAELWSVGAGFTVVANSAEAAVGGPNYRGTHPVGSVVPVRGLGSPGEPAYLEIRDVAPAETLVLVAGD